MARANFSECYRHMEECFLCRGEFQYGPHRYAGRGIKQWQIRICERCESSNDDGIVLEHHLRLRSHLEAQGVPIILNRKGWLDIPR